MDRGDSSLGPAIPREQSVCSHSASSSLEETEKSSTPSPDGSRSAESPRESWWSRDSSSSSSSSSSAICLFRWRSWERSESLGEGIELSGAGEERLNSIRMGDVDLERLYVSEGTGELCGTGDGCGAGDG